jgi:hypothetical protein
VILPHGRFLGIRSYSTRRSDLKIASCRRRQQRLR